MDDASAALLFWMICAVLGGTVLFALAVFCFVAAYGLLVGGLEIRDTTMACQWFDRSRRENKSFVEQTCEFYAARNKADRAERDMWNRKYCELRRENQELLDYIKELEWEAGGRVESDLDREQTPVAEVANGN